MDLTTTSYIVKRELGQCAALADIPGHALPFLAASKLLNLNVLC